MTTNYAKNIDAAIEAACAAVYGAARVSIARQTVTPDFRLDAGDWFILAIDGEVVCRRRTKIEIWRSIQERGKR